MRNQRSIKAAFLLVVAAFAISGCGGSAGDAPAATSSETYAEILSGLKAAETAGRTYGAEHRARDLKAPEREVVRSFCDFAWEIGINREAWKLPVRDLAERRVRHGAFIAGNAYYHPIVVALGKLDAVVHLEGLTAKQLRRYTHACRR